MHPKIIKVKIKHNKFKNARKKQWKLKFLEYLKNSKKHKKNKKLLTFCKNEKFLFLKYNSFFWYKSEMGKSIYDAILLNKDINILYKIYTNILEYENETNEKIKFITAKIHMDKEK